MTEPRRRGRPALAPGEEPRCRMVRLPPELDAAADRARGTTPWSEWLRGLVERAVRKMEGER